MVAIYLTGITIAMLNITGIGFVIFMLLFNQQSGTKLKKANFKKSTTISDSIENSMDKLQITEEKGGKDGGHAVTGKPVTGKRVSTGVATATGAAVVAGTDPLNSNIKKSGDFDNIDNILDDLDLSDFDDLDLDDFN